MKPNKYLHLQKAVLKELDNSDLIHANGGDVKLSRTHRPPLSRKSVLGPSIEPHTQNLPNLVNRMSLG